mmetsp:Transcript_26643/g.72019  ORF Transcript_26643/g.72019 Transcript_26643/m.72019 type:complete len:206 (+) Transcript_26643:517-1134(+)
MRWHLFHSSCPHRQAQLCNPFLSYSSEMTFMLGASKFPSTCLPPASPSLTRASGTRTTSSSTPPLLPAFSTRLWRAMIRASLWYTPASSLLLLCSWLSVSLSKASTNFWGMGLLYHGCARISRMPMRFSSSRSNILSSKSWHSLLSFLADSAMRGASRQLVLICWSQTSACAWLLLGSGWSECSKGNMPNIITNSSTPHAHTSAF